MSIISKFPKDIFEKIVQSSYSFMGVSKKLRYKGIRKSGIDQISKYNINIDHFKGYAWNKNIYMMP